jgi:hypothetical protein
MTTKAMLMNMPRSGRVPRRPQHTWQVRHKPWVIQPFMIAPVLPGETMKNALLQARAVTDPIKNPLIGWWLEYYIFYVKHRDLDDRDEFVNMVLQQGHDLSSLDSTAKVATYHGGGNIDWTQKCLERVTDEYFRDEGETHADHLVDNMPLAKITGQTWLDSAITQTDIAAGGGSLDADPTAQEVDQLLMQWEHLRAMNITTMDYEDFLRTYGVQTKSEEHHRPELIRFIREWQYPSNTVEPTDGSVASAVSWAVSERADKDRFFKEPGFIFGVTVARPKVYMSGQTTSAIGMLDDAFGWLPAVMRDEPATSLKEYASSSGPISGATSGYWVDVRDLYLYGDQFLNFDLTETDAGLVALPSADMSRKWHAASADIEALFTDTADPQVKNLVRQDGICSLTIMGTQIDTTPTLGASTV